MKLIEDVLRVRKTTERLCAPVAVEDYVVQSMPDTSRVKWHLAHTTWFFETFVLRGAPYREAWAYLFISYYEGAVPRHERAQRGTFTRPSDEGSAAPPLGFRTFDGPQAMGYAGPGFAYVNKGPPHNVYLASFEIADRLITSAGELAQMFGDTFSRPESRWLFSGIRLARDAR
jgi:hypothetical protein